MLRNRSGPVAARRHAAILMVAIVLLTLFLVVGIMFALYGESKANSARIYREASMYVADKYPSPEELFGWALGELIYDSQDGQGGQSALYGHGLARNIFGWNYGVVMNPDGTQTILSAPNPVGPGFTPTLPYNATPFSGAGRPAALKDRINYQKLAGVVRRPEWLNDTGSTDVDTGAPMFYTGGFNPPYTMPDLNHVYLASVLSDGTVLKPSFWPGDLSPNPATRLGAASPANPRLSNAAFQPYSLRPLNAPTLHPNFPAIGNGGDVRNRPLGWGPAGNDSVWIDLGYPTIPLAASGRKVKPLFAMLVMDLDGRVNLNAAGNLRGNPSAAPYPPSTLTDTHTSHQGWGKTEINPRWLGNFDTPNAAGMTEYQRLFWGDATIGLNGRYGLWSNLNTQPKPTPTHPQTRTSGGAFPRYYARGDWDASTSPGVNALNGSQVAPDGFNRMLIPANIPAPPTGYFSAFPFFGNRFGDGWDLEAQNHPFLFNPFMLNRFGAARSSATDDRLLPVSDLRWLLAFNSGLEMQNAELFKLAPTFMSNARQRNMITPYSADFDLMGAAPGQLQGGYDMPLPSDPNPLSANRIPQSTVPSSFTNQLPTRGTNRNPGGDFINDDWRSQLATIGRVDLNRTLKPFPQPYPSNGNYYTGPQLTDAITAQAQRVYLAREVFTRLKFATGVDPLPAGGFPASATSPGSRLFEAHRYLAQLAVNIVDYIDEDEFSTPFNWAYDQLQQVPPWPARPDVTGSYPNHASSDNSNYAQFTWTFGTELPRLVINEVYAQVQNSRTDNFMNQAPFAAGGSSDPDTTPTSPNGGMNRPFMGWPNLSMIGSTRATQPYRVNFFVELHNPHSVDPNQGEHNPALPNRAGQERMWLSQVNQAAYRVVIRSAGDNMGTPVPVGSIMNEVWNVTGDPNAMSFTSRISRIFDDFRTDPSFSASGSDPDLDVFCVRPSGGQPWSQYGDRTTNDASNRGYFVLGPWENGVTAAEQSFYRFPHDRAQAGSSVFGTFGATCATGQMSVPLDSTTTPYQAFDGSNAALAQQYQPTVVLQRRACPYLPNQDLPTSGFYNPFVTVDYVENVPINDAILVTGVAGQVRNGGMYGERTPVNQRRSVGRRQPFRAQGMTAQAPQEPQGMNPPAALPFCPQHTFFRQNGQFVPASPGAAGSTLDYPFDWLTHMDRVMISPAELLHVSGMKPHHLTQAFINSTAAVVPPNLKHNQVAPWRVPATRLYRALELLGTRDRTEASAFGGRVMGKININTITDVEVFRALCDASPGTNYFDAATVNAVWNTIRMRRSPAIVPSANDRPFMSLAMPNDAGAADPQYPPPGGVGGVEKGLLGTQTNVPLFDVPAGGTVPAQPYIQSELLRKIFGQITTRSNTFAVWITTGFFEVENTFQQPPRLGREVDVRMRHKFFAVIDRTNLTLDWANSRAQGERPLFFPFTPVDPNDKLLEPGSVTIKVPNVLRTTGVAPAAIFTLYDSVAHGPQDFQTAGFAPPYTYDISISSNNYLVIGSGDSKEIVRITGLNALNHTITVQTTRRHYAGDAVCTQRIGNPGPQGPIDYSLRQFSETVVPYQVILQ